MHWHVRGYDRRGVRLHIGWCNIQAKTQLTLAGMFATGTEAIHLGGWDAEGPASTGGPTQPSSLCADTRHDYGWPEQSPCDSREQGLLRKSGNCGIDKQRIPELLDIVEKGTDHCHLGIHNPGSDASARTA